MVQKQNLPDDVFPCKDCILIVRRRYAKNNMEVNDSLDMLLILEGSEVIKREPVRKMSPGCRYCKGYFSYEMGLIVYPFPSAKVVDREMKRKRRRA